MSGLSAAYGSIRSPVVMASVARMANLLPLRTVASLRAMSSSGTDGQEAAAAMSKEAIDKQVKDLGGGIAPSAKARKKQKAKKESSDLSPMSVAMKFYLERKRQHDAFIAHERSEFELGKRHLANMMGHPEAEDMTQQDVDKAIEYLFPSGLDDPAARPLMKPPDEIFARQKDPEFDSEGRPFHTFFYTTRPHFTQILYDIVDTLENCLFFNDRMQSQGKRPDPELILDETKLTGTRWISREELQDRLLEQISETQYQEFVTAIERLTFQHFSYKYRDLIFSYRVDTAALKSKQEFIQPEFDEQGRAFVEVVGQRKSACAKVRLTKPGSGRVTIEHIDYPDVRSDITYFYGLKERMQVMYPLQFTKLLGLVDLDVLVYAGGSASQAGAIRYATALCCRSFVDDETAEEMMLAGLLTQNIRVRERKKPGKAKARRAFTWNKR